MKKIFTVCLFFFIVTGNELYTQEYKPMLVDSALWYMISIGHGYETNIYKLASGDTLINNKNYKSIISVDGISCNASSMYGMLIYFLREDTLEKKVYYINLYYENLEEKLLYDFSIHPGDTFIADEFNYNKSIILKSIGDTMISDQKWKTFIFHNNTIWIEGIGSLVEPFYVTSSPRSFEGLSCYYRNNDLIYQSEYAKDFVTCCIFTGIEVEKLPQWFKRVYPSPFRDKISIDLQTTCTHTIFLSLVDVTGKEMYRVERKVLPGTETFTLENLGHFNPGMYLLKGALDGEKSFAVKVFKQ